MNGLLNRCRDRSQTCLYGMLCIFFIISIVCIRCGNVETGLRPVSTTTTAYTIYIDSHLGNDKNPGTIKKPIKTISGINDRLKTKPGNILFAGGQVFDGTLLLKNIQGNDSIPVVIGSYGKGRPVISGGNNEAMHI